MITFYQTLLFDAFLAFVIYYQYQLSYLFFRPKDLKLPKTYQFPGKGVIYDYFFDKSTFGTWHPWEKNVPSTEIGADFKVLPHGTVFIT